MKKVLKIIGQDFSVHALGLHMYHVIKQKKCFSHHHRGPDSKRHFIRVCTFCQTTHLGVSGPKWVKVNCRFLLQIMSKFIYQIYLLVISMTY